MYFSTSPMGSILQVCTGSLGLFESILIIYFDSLPNRFRFMQTLLRPRM